MFAAMVALLLPASFRLDENQDENMIKALFVYNFTKQIEWPQGKITDHFVIGVVGKSLVYERLYDILKNRKIKNLPVEIRRFSSTNKIKEFDMLYITNGEKEYLKMYGDLNDPYGVLIITEEKGNTIQNFCINIIEKDERMKFELNESSLKKYGFKISNQLYELAAASK